MAIKNKSKVKDMKDVTRSLLNICAALENDEIPYKKAYALSNTYAKVGQQAIRTIKSGNVKL